MKVATPHSLPEGERSSAGMIVSTAATMNACSASLSASKGSEVLAAAVGLAGGWLGTGVCGVAGELATPAAAAVPATPTPTKESPRGLVSPAMRSSLPCLVAAVHLHGSRSGGRTPGKVELGNGPGCNAVRVLARAAAGGGVAYR